MNNLMIFFLCCVALCVIGGVQSLACGPSDPSKPSTCTNAFGGVGFIICCGSIVYILTRKSAGNNVAR